MKLFRRRPTFEEVLKMQRGLIIEKTDAIGGDPAWAISFDAVELHTNFLTGESIKTPKRVKLAVSDIGLAVVSGKSLTGDVF